MEMNPKGSAHLEANEHDHAPESPPGSIPAHDQVAKRAYAIYVKEGRPKGHEVQNWLKAESDMRHVMHHGHVHMAEDFRNRFWISLILTLPILFLSPMLQALLGLREAFRFRGDLYVLFGSASAVFWYGAWPFLKGF